MKLTVSLHDDIISYYEHVCLPGKCFDIFVLDGTLSFFERRLILDDII